MKFTTDELEVFLAVARDVSLGDTFGERMTAVTEALEPLLPHSSLSIIHLDGRLRGLAGEGQVFWRNGPIDHALLYAESYVQDDPMAPAIPRCDGASHLLTDFLDGKYGRDALTGEYLPQVNIKHLMGSSHRMPGGSILSIAVHREPGMRNFTAREREILRILAPDFARSAFGVLFRMTEGPRPAEACGCGDAGHTSGAAIFGVDGGIEEADGCARALLAGLHGADRGAAALIADVQRIAGRRGGLEGDATVRRYRCEDGRWLRARLSALSAMRGRVLVSVEVIRPGTEQFFDLIAEEAGLTPRERQVARLAVGGNGNRRIAHVLGVSHVTVGVHLTRVYEKTRIPGRAELAAYLLEGRRPEAT